ncbi:hypothetical protein D5086_013438 [Populus alba]|uniref:Uncharacterized protein n=1 Tax=Populus alba TaxID=43335 RepID=A0ACC4C662_POPAL
MGNNNCIGSRVSRDGIFQTISSSVWWARSKDCLITMKENVDGLSLYRVQELPFHAQNKPPEQMKIAREEIINQVPSPPKTKENATVPSEIIMEVEESRPAKPASEKEVKKPAEPTRPNKPLVKRTPSAGLQADVDNSGTIDYMEFITATLHLHKVEKEDHLFAAFSYFDKDGSGYITIDELQQACNEFGMDDVHLEEMIREVDQDNDGSIDYNEFVAMMQRGNTELVKNGLQGKNLSIGFREALSVY